MDVTESKNALAYSFTGFIKAVKSFIVLAPALNGQYFKNNKLAGAVSQNGAGLAEKYASK